MTEGDQGKRPREIRGRDRGRPGKEIERLRETREEIKGAEGRDRGDRGRPREETKGDQGNGPRKRRHLCRPREEIVESPERDRGNRGRDRERPRTGPYSLNVRPHLSWPEKIRGS